MAPEELVQRLERLSQGAEEDFVRLFGPRVRAVLCGRLRDREAAAEIADDVLLAVIVAVRASRLADAARLAAFVMGTARNLANGYRRRRARRPPEEALDADLAADPAAGIVDRERRRRVFEQAQHLDDIDRSIVGLTLAQGLTPAEIARLLRMSPAVVRARKCRAIQRLAQQLGGTRCR